MLKGMLSVPAFQLTVEAAGGPVVLDVTGPAGFAGILLAILKPAYCLLAGGFATATCGGRGNAVRVGARDSCGFRKF
jgi:hypothetical protein